MWKTKYLIGVEKKLAICLTFSSVSLFTNAQKVTNITLLSIYLSLISIKRGSVPLKKETFGKVCESAGWYSIGR